MRCDCGTNGQGEDLRPQSLYLIVTPARTKNVVTISASYMALSLNDMETLSITQTFFPILHILAYVKIRGTFNISRSLDGVEVKALCY